MKHSTDNRRCKPVMIGGGIVLGIGVAILVGFIIMWLWNGLMPGLFELPAITYWQGLGLALLGRLLFGGVGGGNGHSSKKEKIHTHASNCHGDYSNNWQKYDQWWEAEGKKSFESFDNKAEEVID